MSELRVVIVTYNNADTIEDCLNALLAATEKISVNVSVVDNASADDTIERIESALPQVETIPLSGNIGFGPPTTSRCAIARSLSSCCSTPTRASTPDRLGPCCRPFASSRSWPSSVPRCVTTTTSRRCRSARSRA